MLTEEQLQTRAERAAGAKLHFISSLLWYAFSAVFVVALDWWTTGRITWSIWALFGLGSAAASQYSRLLTRSGALREHMVDKELDTLKRRHQGF